MKKSFLVTDPVGLHARPATLLVNEASKYAADTKIIIGDKEANLKSIMGVMSLGVATNQVFEVESVGTDEKEVLNAIAEVVKNSDIGEEK